MEKIRTRKFNRQLCVTVKHEVAGLRPVWSTQSGVRLHFKKPRGVGKKGGERGEERREKKGRIKMYEEGLGLEAHACNPSCLGACGRKIIKFKGSQPGYKVSSRPA